MNEMLVGSIATAWIVAALFFLRYWKTTKDRFFLFFALAFLIEGLNRILFWKAVIFTEDIEAYYLIRLVAYALILVAILDKNRLGKKK